MDRAAVVYLIVYAAERIAHHFGLGLIFPAVQGLLAVAAVAYLAVRLALRFRRHVLWSLRNRLAFVYVFIAVIPIILLVAMVGIAAVLLELQIGAHLLRDDLESHYEIIEADANAIAAALSREPGLPERGSTTSPQVATEMLSRPGVAGVISAARAKAPGLRVFINHGQRLVRAAGGQWAGLAEFRNRLWFASVDSVMISRRQTTLLLVAPLTSSVLNTLPSKLGPIQLTLLEPAAGRASRGLLLDGVRYTPREQVASTTRALSAPANWLDLRIPGVATLEAEQVEPGTNVERRPVLAQFALRPSGVNRDLLTSVGALGPTLEKTLLIIAIIFFVLEAAAFATGILLTRTITRSIADLYDGTLRVSRGEFSHRVRVAKRDQLGALAVSFNQMTGSIAELIEEQRERQRLEHEVEIAREVQRRLFPQVLPSVPGLELGAICQPARVVSGDYYDFLALSPTRVALVLADISGKGIFAALLMASMQAALRSTAMFDGQRSTAAVVSQLNQHLFRNTPDDCYATLFYAVYDSEARVLTYTNAGHLPPFVISDNCIQQLDQGGTVVGLFDDSRYTETTLSVQGPSLFVAFSDGLTESENVYGEEYGSERVKAELLRDRGQPAPKIAENLIHAAEQWSGTPEQADDITVIVARIT